MTPPSAGSTPPRLRVVGSDEPGPTDAALVAALSTGAPNAPAALWRRYATLVRAVLRRTLGPSADPELEDLLQEVFLRVFRSIGNLRDPEALRGFVVGVAINVASKQLRRWAVSRWLRLTEHGALPDTPADLADHDGREAVVRLYAVLDRCNATDRLLFTLRLVHGLELTEVAAAVGVSLATAKRRLARVSEKVRGAAARDPLLSEYLHATT